MGRGSSRSRSGSGSSSGGRGRPRETGTINTWNKDKQFGFVSCNSRNRPDLFVHAEYIENVDQRYKAKNKGLRRGDRIAFDIQEPRPASGKKSAEAVNVELLEMVKRSPTRSGSPDRRRDAPRPQPAMEIRAGDWDCPQCGDHQFARNTECRRCKAPKPLNGGHDARRGGGGGGNRSRSRSRRRRRRRRPARPPADGFGSAACGPSSG
mmetsp:Transcript_87481/g.270867  ORF Transcript_87481/g.270867 Transcript_87481/m.270867 type:complete len:208 (+) Transcript_87481:47-670(+)